MEDSKARISLDGLDGPDQILQATGVTTTEPRGAVVFRDMDATKDVAPMSIPTLLKKTAGKCSTLPSPISICVSVLQFAATVKHLGKMTVSSQFAFNLQT